MNRHKVIITLDIADSFTPEEVAEEVLATIALALGDMEASLGTDVSIVDGQPVPEKED